MNFPYKAFTFLVLLVSQPIWAEETADVTLEIPDTVSEQPAAEQLGLAALMDDIAAAEPDAFLVETGLAQDLSPWGMYQAADNVVKTVMIVLLLASLLTWAVWMTKLLQFAGARRRLNNLHGQVALAGRLSEVKTADVRTAGGMLLKEMRDELAVSRQHAGSSDAGIKERAVTRLQRIQTREASVMTSGMGMLATVGAVAPFVGLFGTVWGIMNAFIAIAHAQTTNLAVVAPGIAEALLATAMGLIAAIPAVVIYNHFSRTIASYRALLTDVSMGLMVLLSRELDAGRLRAEHQVWSRSAEHQISEKVSA